MVRIAGRVIPAVTLALMARAGGAAAEPARPPAVVVLTESVAAGSKGATLAVLAPDGARRELVADVAASNLALAVHAATGRWALTFHGLSGPVPPALAKHAAAIVPARNTLVFGDGTGVIAAAPGEPGCSSKVRECYELPRWFSPDGAYVFVETEGSSWTALGRWTFGAGARRATVADRKTAPSLEVAPDGGRAVYIAADGVHVTTWPRQPTKPRARAPQVPATRTAAVAPDLLMSSVWPIGDRLYYFRRDPVHQEVGWYEATSLADHRTTQLRQAAAAFPMMHGAFWSTGPRGTVLFPDDTDYERAQVFEVAADGTVAAIARDVRAILDVSPDGRYLLISRRKDPALGNVLVNPDRLIILELATGAEVVTLDVGGDGARITAARFVLR